MQRVAEHDPAHVRPEAAVRGRVRIVVRVGMLMMLPMDRHPEQRAALKRQRGAHREEIFHRLGRLVRPVRQQAVIRHADAQREGHVIGDEQDGEAGPGELEQRPDGANMKQGHEETGDPGNLAIASARGGAADS